MADELDISTLRKLVRRGLGDLDEDDISDDDVDLYLNLSLWNIADGFWFKEKECLIKAPTAEGVAEYAVPEPLDAIHSLSIMDDEEGEGKKLLRMEFDAYENFRQEVIANDPQESQKLGFPTRYTRFRDTIYLHPIPDKVYTMRLAIWKTIHSLLAGTVNTLNLPRNWQEIVVEGAITRGHYYNEDYNLARQADNFRVSHERSAVLAKNKENRDKRYARLKVIHEWPDEERG